MLIKKYLVKNMDEAMTRIRHELGNDAVIISQRKVRRPGFKGIFADKQIEVTAAIENSNKRVNDPKPEKKISEEEVFKDTLKDSLQDLKRIMNQEIELKQEAEKKKEEEANKTKKGIDEILDSGKEDNPLEIEVKEMKELLNKVIKKNEIEEKKEDALVELMKSLDIDEEYFEELTNRVKKTKRVSDNKKFEKIIENKEIKKPVFEKIETKPNDKEEKNEKANVQEGEKQLILEKINAVKEEEAKEEEESEGKVDILDLREKLKMVMKEDMDIDSKPIQGNIVLVGPTGVGKTTTIAKLAGRLSFVEKKKVGLITVDTYRIGAVEQLKTYAEIMNLPLQVVRTIEEMDDAIESMKDCDVVLVDTTGSSSKNNSKISLLSSYIQKAHASSICVVLSATTKNYDIETILEGYKVLDYNKVIVTKLDETSKYGLLYNIQRKAKVPLQFITTGQDVPDDIKVPTEDELINFIFGEDVSC